MERSINEPSERIIVIYDHVIIGAGLSGLLKAESLLEQHPPGTPLQVLLVDPQPRDVCHRTFCTWRSKKDSQHLQSHLVSHRYSHFRITENSQPSGSPALIKDFDRFVYERIPGDVFHQAMHKKIFSDSRFQLLEDSIENVTESKNQVVLQTRSNQEIQARSVWNSISQGQPDMIQHFFGFEIETAEDFFDESLVDLMDFRIEQKNEVRFVYHLPFSKTRGLVEFTLFSNHLLTKEEYELELRSYLLKNFNLSEFKIHQSEQGAIPMTLDPWPKFSSPMGHHRILPIGSAAGKIKASTGYSFLRNQESSSPSLFSWRFRVYDTLLIGIMKSKGEEISKIFPKLFSQNESEVLFRFLDEKTRFFEEIRIFVKLPWKNFLLQLILNYPFYFVSLLLISIGLLPPPVSSSSLALWSLPLFGLVTLGITHGAIDHKLNPSFTSLQFYSLYLMGLASFFILWFLSPWLALIGFILISSDHFGESQFLRALKISKNQRRVRWLAFVWGLSASTLAPLLHWPQALPILQTLLRDPQFGLSWPVAQSQILAGVMALGLVLSSFLLTRFEERALGRSLPGLWPSIFLIFTFWKLPLIPGFLCFFCFWHSWDTIQHQKKALGWSYGKYFREAAPWSAVSSLGLLGVMLYFDQIRSIDSYLFLLLGALTTSHWVVMKKFYKIKAS